MEYKVTQIQSSNINTPEIVYETTLVSCTCGDWRYKKSVTGEMCKHQKMLSDEAPLTVAERTWRG
jgi:hypothetical protein